MCRAGEVDLYRDGNIHIRTPKIGVKIAFPGDFWEEVELKTPARASSESLSGHFCKGILKRNHELM